MKGVLVPLILAMYFLPARSDAVEFGFSGVSVNAGYIGTFYQDDPAYGHSYAFYPEFQARGPLLLPSLFWVAFWGYWDDGLETPPSSVDSHVFSFKGHITGGRILYHPRKVSDNWPLPVGVFLGFSHHFIHGEYLAMDEDPGDSPNSINRGSNTFEIGLNLEIPWQGPFGFRAEVRQFIPVSGDDFEKPQKNRRSYTIGISMMR
jgi:hypothetical protein